MRGELSRSAGRLAEQPHAASRMAGAVTTHTRLALTNAIYFLGEWQTPFERERTSAAMGVTSTCPTAVRAARSPPR